MHVRLFRLCLLSLGLMAASVICFPAQTGSENSFGAILPWLREELGQMLKVDQEARFAQIGAIQKLSAEATEASRKAFQEATERVTEIDRKNLARMKQIVGLYGWPGMSLVGKDGAHNAWLLVQHCDSDPPFQKRCLRLMRCAMKRGEVSKSDFAYLTDRVLVAEGKKQIYGTQTHVVDG